VTMPDEPIDRILDAAYASFTRHGIRRTTMDDIAAAAGMSRPGVYQYVKNKDDVFLRLANRLFGAALAQATAAATSEQPLTTRLRLVLGAKLELTLRLVRESPHAAELLDESTRLPGAAVEEFTGQIRELLVDAIAGAADAGQISLADAKATEVAEIIMALTHGLELDLDDPEGLRRRLALGVDLLIAGLGARRR
jgi:TetR/AcrR family transcriptional regulator